MTDTLDEKALEAVARALAAVGDDGAGWRYLIPEARAAIAALDAARAEAGFVEVPVEPTDGTAESFLLKLCDVVWQQATEGEGGFPGTPERRNMIAEARNAVLAKAK